MTTKDKTKEETQTEYLYRRYQIDLSFLTPVAAGLPLNKGLVAAHIGRCIGFEVEAFVLAQSAREKNVNARFGFAATDCCWCCRTAQRAQVVHP